MTEDIIQFMDDIVAFLTARLDEDERAAQFVLSDYAEHEASWGVPATGVVQTRGDLIPTGDGPFAEHVARHDPARVLRGVEVRRQLAALHALEVAKVETTPFDPHTGERLPVEYAVECSVCGWAESDPSSGCMTLRLLASEWRDHADYREGWAP